MCCTEKVPNIFGAAIIVVAAVVNVFVVVAVVVVAFVVERIFVVTIGVDVTIHTVQHDFLRLKLSMLTYFVRLDRIVNFVGPQPNVNVCA